MGLKEKMISELNAEISNTYSANPLPNIDEDSVIKANEHLVSSFIGVFNNQFPSDKRAAEAYINCLSKFIK